MKLHCSDAYSLYRFASTENGLIAICGSFSAVFLFMRRLFFGQSRSLSLNLFETLIKLTLNNSWWQTMRQLSVQGGNQSMTWPMISQWKCGTKYRPCQAWSNVWQQLCFGSTCDQCLAALILASSCSRRWLFVRASCAFNSLTVTLMTFCCWSPLH